MVHARVEARRKSSDDAQLVRSPMTTRGNPRHEETSDAAIHHDDVSEAA